MSRLVFLKDDGKTENLIYDLPSQLFIKSINEPPVYDFVKSSYYAIALQDETGNRLPFQKGQRIMMKIFDESNSQWMNKPGQCVFPWKQSNICYFQGIKWKQSGNYRVTFTLVSSVRLKGTIGETEISFFKPVSSTIGIQWLLQVKDSSLTVIKPRESDEEESSKAESDIYELQPLTKSEISWLENRKKDISDDPSSSVLMKFAYDMHMDLKTVSMKDISILEAFLLSSIGKQNKKQRDRDRKKLLSKHNALLMMRFGMKSEILGGLQLRTVARKITDRGDEFGPFAPLHMADRSNWLEAYENTKKWKIRLDEEINCFVHLNSQVRAAAAGGVPLEARNKIWSRRLPGIDSNQIISRSPQSLRVHRHEGTLAAGETAVFFHRKGLVLEMVANWKMSAKAWLRATRRHVEIRLDELKLENERRLTKARNDLLRFGRTVDETELVEKLRLPDLSSDSVYLSLSSEGLAKADATSVPGLHSLKSFLNAGKQEGQPLFEKQWEEPIKKKAKIVTVKIEEKEEFYEPPPFAPIQKKLWKSRRLPQHILNGKRKDTTQKYENVTAETEDDYTMYPRVPRTCDDNTACSTM